jgi:DNA primase
LVVPLKIVYHCFSCKTNFTDIESASEHSKSLYHEVTEKVRGASEEGKSLLV